MNPEVYRIFNAILFGVSAFLAAWKASAPATWADWVSLVLAGLIASWGKYSSSQTFVAPNRPQWTPEQRAENLGPAK